MQAAGDALAEGLDEEQGSSVTDHEVFRRARMPCHPVLLVACGPAAACCVAPKGPSRDMLALIWHCSCMYPWLLCSHGSMHEPVLCADHGACSGGLRRRHAARYEAEFLEDMDALGCRQPHVLSRVSEYMGEIRDYVDGIAAKGMAYASNGSVYFSTRAFRWEPCTSNPYTPKS